MEKTLNFTSQLVDAKNAWGMKVEGKWNGLIKQVFTGVSFFAFKKYLKTFCDLKL